MDSLIILLMCILLFLVYVYTQPRAPFPRILFQTWKSKTSIPANMAYWSSTCVSKNLSFTHILWDDADNLRFVQEKFPWFLETYEGYDVEIKRADAIRYMFLYTYGGIYLDMDFECLQSFDTLLEEYSYYDILLGSITSNGNYANSMHTIPNAIMFSKPGHPFWLEVLQLLELYSKDSKKGVEEQTGPVVLKEAYLMSSYFYKIKILEPHILYPISWITDSAVRIESLHQKDLLQLTKDALTRYPNSYAITYWTHSW